MGLILDKYVIFGVVLAASICTSALYVTIFHDSRFIQEEYSKVFIVVKYLSQVLEWLVVPIELHTVKYISAYIFIQFRKIDSIRWSHRIKYLTIWEQLKANREQIFRLPSMIDLGD